MTFKKAQYKTFSVKCVESLSLANFWIIIGVILEGSTDDLLSPLSGLYSTVLTFLNLSETANLSSSWNWDSSRRHIRSVSKCSGATGRLASLWAPMLLAFYDLWCSFLTFLAAFWPFWTEVKLSTCRLFAHLTLVSIVGSVVECSPATRAARVRFPDDANLFRPTSPKISNTLAGLTSWVGYRLVPTS